MGGRLHVVAAAVGAWLLLAGPPARAQDDEETATANRVKAVYLLNFAKYVTWPDGAFESDRAPLVIGVVGSGGFAATVERLVTGKTVRDRALSVRRLEARDDEDPPEAALRGCHILFVNDSAAHRLEALLERVRGRDVLTVSDVPSFARRGGMVALTLREGRYVFRINRAQTDRTKLRLSSKLLRLAAEIIEPEDGGGAAQ